MSRPFRWLVLPVAVVCGTLLLSDGTAGAGVPATVACFSFAPSCRRCRRSRLPQQQQKPTTVAARIWDFQDDGVGSAGSPDARADNGTDVPALADASASARTSTYKDERNERWIVVVDDEHAIRLSVGDFLYDSGYQVTACSDKDALLTQVLPDALRQQRNLPDVIVSDIRMRQNPVEGIELVRQLKHDPRYSAVPVVLLTAKGMTQDRIEGYRAGADVYLTKPFDPNELLSIVDNLIRRNAQMSTESSSLRELRSDIAQLKRLLQDNTRRVVQKTNVVLNASERRVLNLLSHGYTNAEIAQRMPQRGSRRNHRSTTSTPVPIPTVNKLIQKLYDLTGTSTRTELVRWGMRTGYIQQDTD